MEEVGENRFDCKIYVLPLSYCLELVANFLCASIKIVNIFQTNNSYSFEIHWNSYCLFVDLQKTGEITTK